MAEEKVKGTLDNSKFNDLRSRAERILAEEGASASQGFRADLEELLHQLDVYRIELELQNEELRSIQRKLEESRGHYMELYNLAPVAFLTVSPVYPHKILGVNSMASRLFGAERGEIIGSSFTGLGAEIRPLAEFINLLKRSEQELTREVPMKRRTKPFEFFARIQALQVKEDNREPRLLIAVTDVTDSVHAREVLRRDRDELENTVRERTLELHIANQDLTRKNQELRDFSFIASHDLREPIRKVQTFGSMLEDRYGSCLDEHARDYLRRIGNASRRMEHMLTSLLEYSRLETRTQPLAEIDLNQVLEQVQANLSDEIERKRAILRVGQLPRIEADPQQMLQIFQNLVSNALKYSERPPQIVIYSENGEQSCTIYVVDNGIGFDMKYLDKIFSPFQRLHGRDMYDGTGMGLTICKKIVERHKGGITATSTQGVGSTFIVTLPYRQ